LQPFVKVKIFEAFTAYKQAAWELVASLWSRLPPPQMAVRENANGVAEDSAMVVVEFETFDKARAFYDSDG
jgi:uncharacterized protein (DUF1330 family)